MSANMSGKFHWRSMSLFGLLTAALQGVTVAHAYDINVILPLTGGGSFLSARLTTVILSLLRHGAVTPMPTIST